MFPREGGVGGGLFFARVFNFFRELLFSISAASSMLIEKLISFVI